MISFIWLLVIFELYGLFKGYSWINLYTKNFNTNGRQAFDKIRTTLFGGCKSRKWKFWKCVSLLSILIIERQTKVEWFCLCLQSFIRQECYDGAALAIKPERRTKQSKRNSLGYSVESTTICLHLFSHI